jgi:hypothetical protein
MPNALIVYCYSQFPPRVTIIDHLYSFRRYSDWNCFYVDAASQAIPSSLWGVGFDAIIFHTTFLSTRWSPEMFARLTAEVAWLRDVPAPKVAMPQDEFIHTDVLCEFLNEVGVDVILSVAPESEWPKIYATVDRDRVRIRQVLTGYLEERTVARIHRLARSEVGRPIDVGYRAWRAAAWLGRHGYLKAAIDDAFRREAPKWGLSTDISTREEDTLLGDSWYRFLLRCKYTIGVEGGASILDRDGSIRVRTDQYAKEHPDASFSEVEAACFPGVDGSFKLFAISPRHLEACATKTCQVLIEGDYNGILKPNEHYIPVKRDLSNLDAVLKTVTEDALRPSITEAAYRDIVASGLYTYRHLVSFVLDEVRAIREPGKVSIYAQARSRIACMQAHIANRLSWILPIAYQTAVVPIIRRLAATSPWTLRLGGKVLRRLGLR